ncbi:MAG: tetratricopeptide repeat protein [Treponema sp.]|jgi:ppGpp synthetase/RelA/SpoT-type nucleotidyltranferase|nr:tetratricopeptide repeat protein [Treponema sp.]
MIVQPNQTIFELPDRAKIHARYETALPALEYMNKAIQQKIKDTVCLSSQPGYKTRVKNFPGYYKKLLRVKSQAAATSEELPLITDLLGIRVVCVFFEDLETVVRQISAAFQVVEIERKGASRKVSEFSYESIHLLLNIPKEIIDEINRPEFGQTVLINMDALVCEVQIRTILQDAWAEVEHELVYKSEFSPFDLPFRRKLASINASLNLADIVFQEIRDYQNKLNRELDYRRQNFYGRADDSTHEMLGGSAEESKILPSLPMVNPFLRGTIDDLILEALQAHNTADYQRAIEIYTRIIQFDPPPNKMVLSVIHKHRGMAFFSQSKYDEAFGDFSTSVAHDPDNFRSFYYCGIVRSLLGDHEGALGYFEKSLAINPFQAHVHYREALAQYQLGEYQEALRELDQSQKLGLDDDDTKLLRSRLVEKFDMK